MAVADRLTEIVSGFLAFAVLAVAGCQGQQPEASATRLGPADNVPTGASRSVSRASSPRSEDGPGSPTQDSALGSPTPSTQETPHGVTTSGTASEAKKVPAEAGQPELSGPAVELVLQFVPGRATTYKITTELEKSVEWKGAAAAKPAQFTDGRTGNHIELTFEQRVQQVQDDGVAILEITIKGIKYVGAVVNKVVLDFDSARPEDAGSPLAVLVGQSYQVKMSPKGQVLEIAKLEPLRQAVDGPLPAHRVAQRLLSEDEVRARHEIVPLSALKESSVRPGQSWSSLRTFSFDDLGAKTYERVYTLKDVGCAVHTFPNGGDERSKSADREGVHGTPYTTVSSKGRTAVVEMKAIPSAALAEELHKAAVVNPFARMSDNADSYQGRLVLDLDRGQVREYAEQMQNEWIIADPTSLEKGQPSAIRMAARRLHRLEQVP